MSLTRSHPICWVRGEYPLEINPTEKNPNCNPPEMNPLVDVHTPEKTPSVLEK